MIWEPVGTVTCSSLRGLSLRRYRYRWESNSSGSVVFELCDPCEGELLELISKHETAGGGTYSVTLVDDLEADHLRSLAAGMTPGLTTRKLLFQEVIAAVQARPLLTIGSKALKITHSVAASHRGVVDLYVR